MSSVKYIAIAALILFGVVLALIGILSVTHDTPVRSVIAEGDKGGPPSTTDPLFARSMELFTGAHIEPGNSVQILLDGNGTYPQLWKDLASAQQTITVQMYYSQPGMVADTMAKYLIDRAQHKVRVLLLLDAFGSQPLKRDWIKNLKRSGVEVVWLRPLRWYTLQKAAQRSHVRVVVVDGKVGYTGGFGLADYWLGDGHHEDQWRETNVRFEGPTGSTPAERYLALSIAGAQKTLYISNSYFVPGDNFLRLLLAAAHRGVDVRVLTVNNKTDVKTTWYAGRTYYEKLLEGGVKIYEYQPTMMHAKSMVVDGMWSSIGSMNFDNRSLSFNDESQLVALDRHVGAQMDSIFMNDIKWSKEIKLNEFRKRPLSGKILEWGAQKLRRVL